MMHYLGMAAMRMQCLITWSWGIVTLSVVIAVFVSSVALASFRFSAGMTCYYKLLAAEGSVYLSARYDYARKRTWRRDYLHCRASAAPHLRLKRDSV